MSKITVIRHSQLEKPFDNYDKLTYDQLEQLAQGEVQPSISQQTPELISKATLLKSNFDAIWHSPAPRARQTAGLIAKTQPVEVPLLEQPTIGEIKFTVKGLITPAEYERHGLQPLRERFYRAIGSGTAGIDSLGSIFERLTELKAALASSNSGNLLLVSHSFFMRYAFHFFVTLAGKEFTETELQHEVQATGGRFDYLDGFFFTSTLP